MQKKQQKNNKKRTDFGISPPLSDNNILEIKKLKIKIVKLNHKVGVLWWTNQKKT